MQPLPLPPPNPTPGAWELLSELLDVKWVFTTLIALYGAIVATFNAFIKDWWTSRPRIKVLLIDAVSFGDGESEEVLMANVINRGYKPRLVVNSISVAVQEIQNQQEGKQQMWWIPSALSNPQLPIMLEPTAAVSIYFKKQVVRDGLKDKGLSHGHVRVAVSDGTNRAYFSQWLEVKA